MKKHRLERLLEMVEEKCGCIFEDMSIDRSCEERPCDVCIMNWLEEGENQ